MKLFKSNKRMLQVSVKYSLQRNQVFQVTPPRNNISLNDIDDALYATKNMDYKNKKDIFASNGIDYDNVSLYYNKVKQLEYLYAISDNIIDVDINKSIHIQNYTVYYIVALFRFIKAFIIMLFKSL